MYLNLNADVVGEWVDPFIGTREAPSPIKYDEKGESFESIYTIWDGNK